MQFLLIGLLITVLAVQGNNGNCHDASETGVNCGNYCLKAVKPVLDYTKFMQSQMEDLKHKSDYLDKLEKLEQQINAKFHLQDKKFDQKLEDLRQLMETKTDRRPFQRIGSKFYYIEQSENVNWFGAVHKCMTLGGHLVSIKNQSEFNAIISQLQPSRHYWIDINDLATEGVFLSVATGLRATYYNWHKNNPDNYRNLEHCGELWFHDNKHLMNDNYCKTKNFFICEPDNQ